MEARDLSGFNDPESQKELRMVYGETINRLEDVQIWDDLLSKEEKALNSELEQEFMWRGHCPHLEKLENYFFYCSKRAKCLQTLGEKITQEVDLDSAQYDSQVNHFSLQFYCMQPEEKHERCVVFKSQNI
jgi:hypothetical protein